MPREQENALLGNAQGSQYAALQMDTFEAHRLPPCVNKTSGAESVEALPLELIHISETT